MKFKKKKDQLEAEILQFWDVTVLSDMRCYCLGGFRVPVLFLRAEVYDLFLG